MYGCIFLFLTIANATDPDQVNCLQEFPYKTDCDQYIIVLKEQRDKIEQKQNALVDYPYQKEWDVYWKSALDDNQWRINCWSELRQAQWFMESDTFFVPLECYRNRKHSAAWNLDRLKAMVGSKFFHARQMPEIMEYGE